MARKQDVQGWKALKRYDKDHLGRIAMPIGGIGTGTISLGGKGDLRNFEIVNRPAKGFTPACSAVGPFFALWLKDGKQVHTRLLEGPLALENYEGAHGAPVFNHGFPRFSECSFSSTYPFARIDLTDRNLPVTASLEAFNPLIPGESDKSGIPVAVLRYRITNKTSRAFSAAICVDLQNFIGDDGSNRAKGYESFANEYREGKGVRGMWMRNTAVNKRAEQWGTIALTTTAPGKLTHRTGWASKSWSGGFLDFWDDFSADGALENRGSSDDWGRHASLCVPLRIPAKGSAEVTFFITWHFPNRYKWYPGIADETGCSPAADYVGNYYATQYKDAWEVAERTAAALPELTNSTSAFANAFCESPLPEEYKEAALFNLSTLRSQTCFRTPDGVLYGWEGCSDKQGSCHGSCTHVWNYEAAVPFLFGDLSRSMREVMFLNSTSDNGHMSFRIGLPLKTSAKESTLAAADGQMGTILKMYLDWKLCGDTAWLLRLWPKVRKALEFCWIPGGWDADRDGVMEGCQHNTMDVEYYGPNPQMSVYYLAALRSCEEMAKAVGENDFANECRSLYAKGRAWIEKNLFNGEYFEHKVVPPMEEKNIAAGLRSGMGASDLKDPQLQLGAGCLVDQLVGQYLAHVCGLGDVINPKMAQKTLASVLKYNRRKGLHSHFNFLRSFALGSESAVLMATYPLGRRPKQPFPYYTEVMTGFEYCLAGHLAYIGKEKEAASVVADIRDRYDGQRRNPFDEAECGHHYARAMASWALVTADSGFDYDGTAKRITFANKPGKHFWSNGAAWGTCEIKPGKRKATAKLDVLGGQVEISQFRICGIGEKIYASTKKLAGGTIIRLEIKQA